MDEITFSERRCYSQRHSGFLNGNKLHRAGRRTGRSVAVNEHIADQRGDLARAARTDAGQSKGTGSQEFGEDLVRLPAGRKLRFIWRLIVEILDDVKAIRLHTLEQPRE